MGYNKFNLKYIFDIVGNNKIANMLELGNQCINNKDIDHIKTQWGKVYFTEIGINHISIDWNGQNGALKLDLTKPIGFIDYFDLVTNCGTTEHIESQYEVFRNLHDCGRVGCFYVNSVPLDTQQNINIHGVPTKPHGIYEYNTLFFIRLCELCNYEIIDINTDQATWEDQQGFCNAIYKKVKNNTFISKDTFDKLSMYLRYYPNGSNK